MKMTEVKHYIFYVFRLKKLNFRWYLLDKKNRIIFLK